MSSDRLCRLKEEKRLDLTSLHHLTIVLSYKLWWLYRTSDSIWAKFMRSKYVDFTYIRTYGVSLTLASHTLRRIIDV